MIYAQIKDNIVSNIIILDDESLIPLFSEGFDLLMRVDQLGLYPSSGWGYDPDTQTFSPPTN